MDPNESLQVGKPEPSSAKVCVRVWALHGYGADKEGLFLPGAVFTVDVASERQLVGFKVVLSLLCDADLFKHGI